MGEEGGPSGKVRMGGQGWVPGGRKGPVRATDGPARGCGGEKLRPLDQMKLAPPRSTREHVRAVCMGVRVCLHTRTPSLTFLSPNTRLFPPLC